jgi:hypothetical protein
MSRDGRGVLVDRIDAQLLSLSIELALPAGRAQ